MKQLVCDWQTVDGLIAACSDPAFHSTNPTVTSQDTQAFLQAISKLKEFVVLMNPSITVVEEGKKEKLAKQSKRDRMKAKQQKSATMPDKQAGMQEKKPKELKRKKSSIKTSLFRGVRVLVSKKKSRLLPYFYQANNRSVTVRDICVGFRRMGSIWI